MDITWGWKGLEIMSKVSEVIARLQELQDKYGDLPVFINSENEMYEVCSDIFHKQNEMTIDIHNGPLKYKKTYPECIVY